MNFSYRLIAALLIVPAQFSQTTYQIIPTEQHSIEENYYRMRAALSQKIENMRRLVILEKRLRLATGQACKQINQAQIIIKKVCDSYTEENDDLTLEYSPESFGRLEVLMENFEKEQKALMCRFMPRVAKMYYQ
jgi:hypothetical protein